MAELDHRRVLFIDDQPEVVRPARLAAERKGAICKTTSFPDAESEIGNFEPDVVVVDLFNGEPPEGEQAGQNTIEFVWDHRFCPIIVYSAFPDYADDVPKNHPFVKLVRKGAKSPDEVCQALSDYERHIESIHAADIDTRKAFALAIRDVAPYAFRHFETEEARNDAIIRGGRRRLAAMMDEMPLDREQLQSWEQYLCPPIRSSLQLGDVLVKQGHNDLHASSYRIVLSPSCDLATDNGRTPKVKNALVARCIGFPEALEKMEVSKKPKKNREKLNKILSQGYTAELLPLPELQGRIPHMVADLKDLELIKLTDGGALEKPYRRIASVDSPFRELVSWAYIQTAGRPGLPSRDTIRWTESIQTWIDSTTSDSIDEGD